MEYNFDLVFSNLDGRPLMIANGKSLKAAKMYEYLSLILVDYQSKGQAVKLYEMACKIRKDRKIELDTSDKELVEQAINASTTYNNLVTAQLLLQLKNQQEEGKDA